MTNIAVPAESEQTTSNPEHVRADLERVLQLRSGRLASPSAALVRLQRFNAVRLEGADARSFLQGQVSADVQALADLGATMASYCSAKGRMLASFLTVRDGDAIRLMVRANLAAAFVKRLSMFVLRSKVKITLEADRVALFGLIGPRRGTALAAVGIDQIPDVYRAVRDKIGDCWISLPGERSLAMVDATRASDLVAALAPHVLSVDESCWHWIDVEQGIAYIEQATQDELTPQMANLELIGGVSFSKGCYPGQEVVARTQHLGKVKRRVYRAHVEGDTVPAVGTAVFAPSHGEQSVGMVLSVAPAPGGGFDLLMSMISAAVHAGRIAIGDLAGPQLSLSTLPYALPD